MRWLALALVLLMAPANVAEACGGGCFDDGGSSSGRSVRRAPAKAAPRAPARPAPRATPRPTPRPVPRAQTVAAAMGLHRVNKVWAGDVVQRKGPVTTYTSKTAQQNAGTFAKQVASVASGQKSAYDLVLSNKRTTMTDGRAVSGDIYANYIWNGSTMKLDRFVFFQDDREVARAATPTAAPVRTAAPVPTPAPRATPRPAVATPRSTLRSASTPRPRSTPRPAATVRPNRTPRPTATPRAPAVVSAGLALAAQGDALARVEVLRGRRVELWPRALVDGSPGRVVSWTYASGEVTALGPLGGSSDGPFAARWDQITPPGSWFTVRMSVTVDVPGEGQRTVSASIEVLVRSPAIVE